ncbi:redox-sensing transcriptional repressor Rex [Dehalococcoidia bacterium]|nr:redox-sensing transcriptional repressor Rex [Dehalococcoidia bacterium]MCL0102866.1 redox-sensing transcriptional repressor Rex [Dehalococcoidia bacterium]
MNQKRDRQFGVPPPALQRMPVYYRRLMKAIEEEMPFVSSDELGRGVGVPGAQVRKDLSHLSQQGRPGIGYDARSLASHLEEFLGLINDKEAVLAGVGNLGRALALYPGFERYRLQIIALFDNDVAKVGKTIGGRRILPMEKLANLSQRLHIQMGIITVPASAAQEVAETMIAGGIRVIWNFAPCRLAVPEDVLVKNEDLAAELATLSHHITRRKVAMPDEVGRGDGDGGRLEEYLC